MPYYTTFLMVSVEEFVNKLKVVKMMMYGKAPLNLLRNKMAFSELGFN